MLLLAGIREAAKNGDARRAREQARISRMEVAAACGVDQSTVARWELGTRSPRGEAGLKYARLIGRLRHVAQEKKESTS